MGDPRPFLKRALTNADATVEHFSDDATDASALGSVMVTGFNRFVSAQVTWSGVATPSGTSTAGGVVYLEHSPDGKPGSWNETDRYTTALESPSGTAEIRVERITQECWRVHYEPNSTTDGLVTVAVFSY